MLPGASFLVAVSYVGCNHILTVIFLTLSTTIGGISSSGVFINQIDIAPRWVLHVCALLTLRFRHVLDLDPV